MNNIDGFKVIPIKFSNHSKSHHDIFIKEHIVRRQEEDKPAGKTLFVLNIPPYVTECSLKRVFSVVGKVRRVILLAKPADDSGDRDTQNGFKYAYVVFQNRDSVQKLLQFDQLGPFSIDEEPVLTGVRKWTKNYNNSIYDPKILEEQVNKFMTEYDNQEATEKENVEEVDEEGWTIVSKKSRNPGLARKESVENKLKEKMKSKAKKKELKNFYTYQIRESKKQHIDTLRKSYEEAKKRVNQIKMSRTFKPY